MLQPNKHEALLFDRPCYYGILHDVCDSNKLKLVKEAILQQTFYHKSNDLYEFYQTEDLRRSQNAIIQDFLQHLYSPKMLDFMSELTGLTLSSHRIDVSAHRYPQGGYLLCHDDDIADELDQEPSIPYQMKTSYSRRIAYILYLVEEDWEEKDGGMLQFYDVVTASEGSHQPGRVSKSILPRWNSMAFFEVTPTSYHQVQEVFRVDDRVSISGWFHGPTPLHRPEPHLALPSSPSSADPLFISPHEDVILADFIHPTYLTSSAMNSIAEQFAVKGCIDLTQFLLPHVYEEIIDELTNTTMEHWTSLGPPTLRSLQKLSFHNQSPPRTLKCMSCFASRSFQSYLRSVSRLDLQSQPTIAACHQYIPSSYTLLHDESAEPCGLDVVFHIVPSDLPPSSLPSRGQMVYVCQNETLATLARSSNTLSLILRDEKDILRFVKYVSHGWKSNDVRWWDMSFVWEEECAHN